MTLGHELRVVDVMNNLEHWMIRRIRRHVLKYLNALSSFGLWLTSITLGHELMALDAMNN